VVGRITADAVTTLGSGVDGAVRRIETNYDTAGRLYQSTSYDAASSGTIVNQIQRGYNGLGQLTVEYQAVSGAVNTSTSPKVQYAYSEMPSGANHSRLTSITYPNGRVITYNYASGLASNISRLSSISDNGTTLEGYDYLGLGTVVRRTHPQPGVDLTYIKQGMESDGDAGDQYTGLDRFGRIVDQRWIKTSNGSHIDRFQYGYDRNGNRLYEKNLVDAAFSELYHANGASNGYDLLNQISEFRRGVLSDTNSDGIPDTVTTASRSQVWSYDPLGNWSTVNNDGTAQNRTHNRQNQITSISGLTTPTYDANGNMTGDENGKTLVYDAWNRLVDYKNGSTSLEAYQYDALNRRITENPGTARALFYSADWKVIEERVASIVETSLVWTPLLPRTLILRDRDSDLSGSLDERLYASSDARNSVRSVFSTSSIPIECFALTPWGEVQYLSGSHSPRTASAVAWVVIDAHLRFSTVSLLYGDEVSGRSPSLGIWVTLTSRGMTRASYSRIPEVLRSQQKDTGCKWGVHCWPVAAGVGMHCGVHLVIGDKCIAIDGMPGAGGSTNQIIGNPGCTTFEIMPCDQRLKASPGILGGVLPSPTNIWAAESSLCRCILAYAFSFRLDPCPARYHYKNCNSSWALSCALRGCGVDVIWTDSFRPSYYGICRYCVKWGMHTRGGHCFCLEERDYPCPKYKDIGLSLPQMVDHIVTR
jgi:YD repeat-containing protein